MKNHDLQHHCSMQAAYDAFLEGNKDIGYQHPHCVFFTGFLQQVPFICSYEPDGQVTFNDADYDFFYASAAVSLVRKPFSTPSLFARKDHETSTLFTRR